MMVVQAVLLYGVCVVSAAEKAAKPDGLPENLAPKAKASASSEYSDEYRAKFATDGDIPGPGSNADVGKAWATKGMHAADFTLEWDSPVTVAEVVYYGRTAFMLSECFKDYEVYVDGASKPAVKGALKMGHGPQRIKLPAPAQVKKLTLKFLSSYGGSNPGAAEIQVFAASPSDKALGKFLAAAGMAAAEPPAEDPGLAAEIAAGRLGFDKLIFIKRVATNPSHIYANHSEGFAPGGGIFVLSPPKPEGTVTQILDAGQGMILDLDLSYDGKEVVFAWRQSGAVGYQVFRMNVDGTGLTQLTHSSSHNYNVAWLADGGIAFLSTRGPRGAGALCFGTASGVLFRMDRDGKNPLRLSSNNVDDFTPTTLPDGRILYSRWEYVDRPAIPIQKIWAMHPDGTGLRLFYGNRVLCPASLLEARPVPGTDLAMCTFASHNGPIRGAVGLVSPNRLDNTQDAMTNLTPQVHVGPACQGDGNGVRGPFSLPKPIDTKRFIVSRDGWLMLGEIGRGMALLYGAADRLGCYNGLPLRPRERPFPIYQLPIVAQTPAAEGAEAGAAPAAAGAQPACSAGGAGKTCPTCPIDNVPATWEREGEATVYLVDVYRGLEPYVKRGTVKAVCVVEELAKGHRVDEQGFGFMRPVISGGATYAAKKVWGTVPVNDDGSAYFKVPANKALYFMALDKDGAAVQRMRSFVHFAPGETQGCVGCHEPRNTPPPVGFAQPTALRAPPKALAEPSWGAANFDYVQLVQPVLDKNCASCHSGTRPAGRIDLTGDKTDWFNISYDNLVRGGRGLVSWIPTNNGAEQNILQIAPKTWGTPASKLAEIILSGHPDKDGKPQAQLDRDSRQRLFTWIDLNVPYYSTYELPEGGHHRYPHELQAKYGEVWTRRCAGCHQSEQPRGTEYVRITNPQLNRFLCAPLAAAAGGAGICKGEVFKSARDPDYQLLLGILKKTEADLAKYPRMDMGHVKPSEQMNNRSRI